MGGDDSLSRPHRRRSLLVAGGIVALVVVAIAVITGVWFTRESPGERSLDDALAEFRAGDPRALESIGAVVQRPRPGVYVAEGSGRASIDFPPTSQSYGATIPVIVRADGEDCWTTEVDFNEDFRQTWSQCVRDGDVIERSNLTVTRWDLGVMTVEERADFRCDPPGTIIRTGARPGDESRYRCLGTTTSVSGITTSEVSFTLVDAESIDIAGVAVPTFHHVEVDTLEGPQRGTTRIDYWYTVETFLLVRMERTVRLRTDSPIGQVTYAETGSWRLRSLEPLR
ncbi:MAG: hypothetical protein FGM58_05315 [Acidimicrobiia bacterium]|nr:hypothetical protein [Acidimicrobiia bacterium]